MHCMRISLPARLAGLVVFCAAAPALAQTVELAAAPPAQAIAYRISEADARDAVCANAAQVDVHVPAEAWVEMPIGWFAKDEATARSNWKSMSYTISLGDRPLEPPAGVHWQMYRVRFECPKQIMEGMFLAPVVYVPPAASERTYNLHFTFEQDVSDGWSTFKKGTGATWAIRLLPVAELAAPAAPAKATPRVRE